MATIKNPGKYDDLCTYVREQSNAAAAVVIIVGGNQGHGFSVQAFADMSSQLPDMLEDIARRMRKAQPLQ
jgi:hypothetical protein